ncbi:MAG: hypothetical protein HC802_20580, partial [Caldilineaceae bacterium]|nr:hypothetical protein [Caldilineaceae bacterium]
MTAGVAHEINNPVAAVQRGSGQLADAAEEFAEARLNVSQVGLSSDQLGVMDSLLERARTDALNPPEMDALARSDLEYELESWLEDHDVEDGWEFAPILASLNYGPDDLSVLVDHFSNEQLTPVVGALSATYSLYNLLAEINRGSERIAEIVKALKSYSYLDQRPCKMSTSTKASTTRC